MLINIIKNLKLENKLLWNLWQDILKQSRAIIISQVLLMCNIFTNSPKILIHTNIY